jgi:hypothetical protein
MDLTIGLLDQENLILNSKVDKNTLELQIAAHITMLTTSLKESKCLIQNVNVVCLVFTLISFWRFVVASFCTNTSAGETL